MTDQYVAAGIAPRDRFVTVYSGFDVEPFLTPTQEFSGTGSASGIGTWTRTCCHRKSRAAVSAEGARIHRPGRACGRGQIRRVLGFMFVGDGILRTRGFEAELWSFQGLRRVALFLRGWCHRRRVAELIHADGYCRPYQRHMGRPKRQRAATGLDRQENQSSATTLTAALREMSIINGQTGFFNLPAQSIDALKRHAASFNWPTIPRSEIAWAKPDGLVFTDQFRHQTMTKQIREVYANVIASATVPYFGRTVNFLAEARGVRRFQYAAAIIRPVTCRRAP